MQWHRHALLCFHLDVNSVDRVLPPKPSVQIANLDSLSQVANQNQKAGLPMSSVQSDPVYNKPCIYMQLDTSISDQSEEEEEDTDALEEDISPELRFIPRDSSICKHLCSACFCDFSICFHAVLPLNCPTF